MDMMKSKLREMQRQLVRPVTKENVFYHYLPMFGVKSYLELSLNVFNPSLSSEIYKRLVQDFFIVQGFALIDCKYSVIVCLMKIINISILRIRSASFVHEVLSEA